MLKELYLPPSGVPCPSAISRGSLEACIEKEAHVEVSEPTSSSLMPRAMALRSMSLLTSAWRHLQPLWCMRPVPTSGTYRASWGLLLPSGNWVRGISLRSGQHASLDEVAKYVCQETGGDYGAKLQCAFACSFMADAS